MALERLFYENVRGIIHSSLLKEQNKNIFTAGRRTHSTTTHTRFLSLHSSFSSDVM